MELLKAFSTELIKILKLSFKINKTEPLLTNIMPT